MENLRWILIFAGVAILALLYFSGRSTSATTTRTRNMRPSADDLEMDSELGSSDPLLGHPAHREGYTDGDFAQFPQNEFVQVDADDLARPSAAQDIPAVDIDPAHIDRFHGELDDGYLPPELQEEPSRSSGLSDTAAGALGGLSQKIDAIGAKLSGKRRERVAERHPPRTSEEAPVYASKIITLHVVAQSQGSNESVLDGQALRSAFERRDFTFGEMNIFHSMHHGKTVFSIAKMVEPGWFDPQDVNSFSTPGITLILQLPGPVAADTAFEVLLSEAYEIANELGGIVLDGDRSTLSKQTAQHIREGIYEYMHRQKYFGSVTT